MKEEKFYVVLDKVEKIKDKDVTEGYFPTIEEIESHDVLNNQELYLPIIAYMAQDPFKDSDNDAKNTVEYKASVKYCKDLLTKFDVEE